MNEKYVPVTRLKLTMLNIQDGEQARGNSLGVWYIDWFIKILDFYAKEVDVNASKESE